MAWRRERHIHAERSRAKKSCCAAICIERRGGGPLGFPGPLTCAKPREPETSEIGPALANTAEERESEDAGAYLNEPRGDEPYSRGARSGPGVCIFVYSCVCVCEAA